MVIPYTHSNGKIYGGTPSNGCWDGKRYIFVRKKFPTRKVARLVCEAFNGSPQKDQVCMHLDENAKNNKPENLQWGTQKENLNFPNVKAWHRSRTGINSASYIGRTK